MTWRLVALHIDANDPLGLARFWATALRWTIAEPTVTDEAATTVRLVPTDGTPFEIQFGSVAEHKTSQNRIHFDLTTTSLDDQEHSVRSLLALGARHVDIGQSPGEAHVVLADPEGNEFCVIEPTNSFLAKCERLGAVNCDGTQALGYFWSAVLGWPLVWDQDEETAIRAPGGIGPLITWSGPPLMPRIGKDRVRFHIASGPEDDPLSELDRLIALGATLVDGGGRDDERMDMADPDANVIRVLSRRSNDA